MLRSILTNVITQAIPDSPSFEKDKLLKQLLDKFDSLGLVTREEFDAQARVLVRCQDRLKQLETELRELEGQSDAP